MFCECCNQKLRSLNSLIGHINLKNECKEFYKNKFSMSKNIILCNREIVICESCNKWCISTMGMKSHVLQHSKKCLNFYNLKYTKDRTKWPKNSLLRKKSCKDCGVELKDSRSLSYCAKCSSEKHNVMKNHENKVKVSKKMKRNWKNPEYVKKCLDGIHNSEKTIMNNKVLQEKQKLYMLMGGAVKARKATKRISKPQLKLFNLVKQLFQKVELEYEIKISNKKHALIDIAVPLKFLAIEYNEPYWHQNKEYDNKRKIGLEKLGWKVVIFEKIPSLQKLIYELNKFLDDKSKINLVNLSSKKENKRK